MTAASPSLTAERVEGDRDASWPVVSSFAVILSKACRAALLSPEYFILAAQCILLFLAQV